MKRLKHLFVYSDLFYLCLIVFSILLFDNFMIHFLLIILWFSLLSFYQKKLKIIILIISILFLLRLHCVFKVPNFTTSTIVEITESQTVFQEGIFYASSFGTDFGQLGDNVNLEATLTVHKTSPYQQGLFLKNNIGQLEINKSVVTGRSKAPIIVLRKLIQNHKASDLLGFYLQQSGDYQSLNSSLYFSLLSVGIHFSSSLRILTTLLEKFFNELIVRKLQLVILTVYGLFFGFSYVIIRLFIAVILSFTNIRRNERNMIEMLLGLFLYPMAFGSTVFILIYAIKFSDFIRPDLLENYLTRYSFLAFLQLNLFYRFNWIESCLFPLFRNVSGLLFLLSGASLLLPTSSILINAHESILFLLNQYHFSHFTIVGKPNLIINFLWFICFLKINKRSLKRFLFPGLIYLQTLFYLIDASVRVVYIDVKQGDATLIKFPNQRGAVLIDTAKPNQYVNVEKQLHRLGVDKLSALIITHNDLDHSGNKEKLMRKFQLELLVEKSNQQLSLPINFRFLLPERRPEEINDESLIVHFSVNGLSFLFTGDASKRIERILMKEYPGLSADIFKLGHHGSNTSSDEKFLHSLHSKLVIISSDPLSYNHPHPQVLRSLYDLKINTLQTSGSGTIEIIITKYFNFIKTDKSFYFLN